MGQRQYTFRKNQSGLRKDDKVRRWTIALRWKFLPSTLRTFQWPNDEINLKRYQTALKTWSETYLVYSEPTTRAYSAPTPSRSHADTKSFSSVWSCWGTRKCCESSAVFTLTVLFRSERRRHWTGIIHPANVNLWRSYWSCVESYILQCSSCDLQHVWP